MKTSDLVDRLAADTVPPQPIARTLAVGLGAGALVSFVLMLAWLGLRPDLPLAIGTGMFWMKLGYAVAFAAIAFPLALALSRPTGLLTRAAYLLLAPLGIVALMAVYRLTTAAPDARMHLVMGNSSDVCPWRILALSIPVLVGAFVSLRRLAPTHLATAGAIAGILAGALGTFIYAWHCDESAAPFVAVWYTFGMASMGILGGLLGRFALRW